MVKQQDKEKEKKKEAKMLSLDRDEFNVRLLEKLVDLLSEFEKGNELLEYAIKEIIQEDLAEQLRHSIMFIDGRNGTLN